jgi:hypothetical protein
MPLQGKAETRIISTLVFQGDDDDDDDDNNNNNNNNKY